MRDASPFRGYLWSLLTCWFIGRFSCAPAMAQAAVTNNKPGEAAPSRLPRWMWCVWPGLLGR